MLVVSKDHVYIIVLGEHITIKHLIPAYWLMLSQVRVRGIGVLNCCKEVIQFQGRFVCHSRFLPVLTSCPFDRCYTTCVVVLWLRLITRLMWKPYDILSPFHEEHLWAGA